MTIWAGLARALTESALGEIVTYRAGGTGTPVAVRAIRSSVDRVLGDGLMVRAEQIELPVAAVPNLARGDRIDASDGSWQVISDPRREGALAIAELRRWS